MRRRFLGVVRYRTRRNGREVEVQRSGHEAGEVAIDLADYVLDLHDAGVRRVSIAIWHYGSDGRRSFLLAAAGEIPRCIQVVDELLLLAASTAHPDVRLSD